MLSGVFSARSTMVILKCLLDVAFGAQNIRLMTQQEDSLCVLSPQGGQLTFNLGRSESTIVRFANFHTF